MLHAFSSGDVRACLPDQRRSRRQLDAVNEHGIALCLLNGRCSEPARGACSRGHVLPELIWLRTIDDCAYILGHTELAAVAPFTLLMLEPGLPATVAAWDGATLAFDRDADRRAPLVSSSFDSEGVRRSRSREFARHGGNDAASLYRFHASHGEAAAHTRRACIALTPRP
jgi:hypothetical protein